MARTVCGHCKQQWLTKKDYDKRGTCLEPCCPNNLKTEATPQRTADQRRHVRDTVDKIINGDPAPDKDKKVPKEGHTPVNLHVVGPLRHHPKCRCPTCLDEKRGYNDKGLGLASNDGKIAMEVKPTLVPQAKIRVYFEEVEVESNSPDDADYSLVVEVPKIQVIKIIPQGVKKKRNK